MEVLVAAVNSFDGTLGAALKLEELVWDYERENKTLRRRLLDPVCDVEDAKTLYATLSGVTVTLDDFCAMCRVAKRGKEDKLKKKIVEDFHSQDAKRLEKHEHKLLEELLHVNQEYELDNDGDDCERFARDFFPEQGIDFVRWLKEVHGFLYDQKSTFKEFLESIKAGRIAAGHLEFLDGWDENFSREEARDFFEKEIIPRTPQELVYKVWAYFEHNLLCADDDDGEKEPADKKLKSHE